MNTKKRSLTQTSVFQETVKEKRNVTPEKAVEILKQHGTVVSLEEASIILDFMYKLSTLSIEQNVKL